MSVKMSGLSFLNAEVVVIWLEDYACYLFMLWGDKKDQCTQTVMFSNINPQLLNIYLSTKSLETVVHSEKGIVNEHEI